MPRPKKPDAERRRRWDALYVTDCERIGITQAAQLADKSVSAYLIDRHLGATLQDPRVHLGRLQCLTRIEALLLELGQTIPAEPEQADLFLDRLGKIEATARQIALDQGIS
jgi:hypothetical protein